VNANDDVIFDRSSVYIASMTQRHILADLDRKMFINVNDTTILNIGAFAYLDTALVTSDDGKRPDPASFMDDNASQDNG